MGSEIERECGTCRYWDIHSLGAMKGDCRAPNDHRYSRVPIQNPKDQSWSHALMDSFGPEETTHKFRCGAWQHGQEDGPLALYSILGDEER